MILSLLALGPLLGSIIYELSGTSRQSLIESAEEICTPGNYLNCKLFVQLLTDTPRLRDLPLADRKRVGDVLQYGSNPPRHWAIYIGDDEVIHIPEWGGTLEIEHWDTVEEEHGPPIIRRAPSSPKGHLE